MNQSQFLAITCNLLEARGKSRVRGAIGFGFDSHWPKNWRESFKPITKRSNRNHVTTFDRHLKTALFYFISFRSIEEPCPKLLSGENHKPCYDRIITQLSLEWIHINLLQFLILIELKLFQTTSRGLFEVITKRN